MATGSDVTTNPRWRPTAMASLPQICRLYYLDSFTVLLFHDKTMLTKYLIVCLRGLIPCLSYCKQKRVNIGVPNKADNWLGDPIYICFLCFVFVALFGKEVCQLTVVLSDDVIYFLSVCCSIIGFSIICNLACQSRLHSYNSEQYLSVLGM